MRNCLHFFSSVIFLNLLFFNLLKERSPEQLVRMAQTLPPMGEGFLKSSLPVTSKTSPFWFSATSRPKAESGRDGDHEKGEVSPYLSAVFWCGLALITHRQMCSLNLKEDSGSVLPQEGLVPHRHERWEMHTKIASRCSCLQNKFED